MMCANITSHHMLTRWKRQLWCDKLWRCQPWCVLRNLLLHSNSSVCVWTVVGQRSFTINRPTTWNSLPPALRAPELSQNTSHVHWRRTCSRPTGTVQMFLTQFWHWIWLHWLTDSHQYTTLGVGGVDPVNNVILYIIILYIIYTYTAYGFPIHATSSRSASASASDAAVCVSKVYDVMTSLLCYYCMVCDMSNFLLNEYEWMNEWMTMPLTTRVIQIYQLFHPPKNWVVRSPPYFAQGGWPRKCSNFRENLTTSFHEIFWNRKYIFRAPPLQGVWMLRVYIFEYSKAPNYTKNFESPRPPILEI